MKIENVKGIVEVLDGDARNAMHSILGFLELLSEGALNPEQREYLEACRAVADRHRRDIEDALLVLGVISDENQVITHFVPAELFARVRDVTSVIGKSKGCKLSWEIDGSVPPIVAADVDRIGYTLTRLAEGVVRAIAAGEVHFVLRAMPLPDGYNLTFEILAPARELLPVLMRSLQQDEFEFEASLSGSGALGLAAARKLAMALAGRVDASADASAGTRIAITIPVRAAAAVVVPPKPVERLSPGTQRPLRILVAEDSDDSFRLFTAYLQGQPHTVTRAANGAEAIELASTGSFDLLFMDIRMPVMDGYAATRRIRELETGKDRARLPIVVLSAEDLRAQRRQGALVGCSGHLSKPLRKHELFEAIRVYSMHDSSILESPISVPTH
jgi:hypothetical protein